ncbi:MAG TPA: NAD(+)/NADH kinase [Acidimicrobiales bacterium]|nr:NAD(+)/NADH kinase [Acidimicrobiales bacterium]
MARIGFAPHSDRPAVVEVAAASAAWLEEEGHKTIVLSDSQQDGQGDGIGDLDLMVSLGGDGTMLRAVGLVLGTGVPVLGVNFGAFGYLTAVEPEGLRHALERFLAGDYRLLRRMTVDAVVAAGANEQARLRATGLNDVVLARPSGIHTISTRVSVAGEHFLSYTADAMIVSSATGTTGYNLSARGPIVSPEVRCLVLTPVAPHMLFDRSVVLDGSDELSLEVQGRSCAELIVDGVPRGDVQVGERVSCRAGAHEAILVSFGDRTFESVLKHKFRLADR